jgi:hypothetical protein
LLVRRGDLGDIVFGERNVGPAAHPRECAAVDHDLAEPPPVAERHAGDGVAHAGFRQRLHPLGPSAGKLETPPVALPPRVSVPRSYYSRSSLPLKPPLRGKQDYHVEPTPR